jgi:phosphatidylglycerophosphatase A
VAPAESPETAGGHSRRSKPARIWVAYVLGTWFGFGYTPYAPGTAGTIGAVPLYLLLRPCGLPAVLGAALALTVVGIWAASIVATDTGLKDPQIVVIDEVAGVLCTLAVAPGAWTGVIVGVVLFRVFDQWKPWPARAAERRLPGGYGIVLDDIAAGAWGAAVMLGLRVTHVL